MYEKQCIECGLIWESDTFIPENPFICPSCQKKIWQEKCHEAEQQTSMSKAAMVLQRNKEKYT